MPCLHCTSRVLRVFISGSASAVGLPSTRVLRSSRTFASAARAYTPSNPNSALPHSQRRAFNHQTQTQTPTSTTIRPLNDDYIPFVQHAEETVPSALRERLKGEMEAGDVNPVGPPPPVPEKSSLEEWDIAALMGVANLKVVRRERVVREVMPEAESEAVGEEEVVAKEVEGGVKEDEHVTGSAEEEPEKKLEEVLAPKKKNANADLIARVKARKDAAAAEELQERKERKELKSRRKLAVDTETPRLLASKPHIPEEKPKPVLLHKTRWNLPDPEAELPKEVPQKTARLEAYMSTLRNREIPHWMKQKAGLSRKFGDEGWNPLKKLSPDAMEGIRTLHAEDPEQFHVRKLADLFEVSAEAIRRILKSKWRPKEEESEDRLRRWESRGKAIFDKQVEEGKIIPKSRKRRAKEENREKAKSRSILDQPTSDLDRFL